MIRSERARLMRLRVGPDPVVRIVVPVRHRIGRIHDLLKPHSRWIFKQLERFGNGPADTRPPTTGDRLPYLGRDLVLEITGERNRRPVLIGERLVLAAADPALLNALLEYWYREQARSYLTSRVEAIAARMNVGYGRIAIRDQKSRWGSCSSRGNLNFSWRLVMAPQEIADYVVIHELAHLSVPNHSSAFWALVEEYCPERKHHQRWLRDNGDRLAGAFRFGT